MMKGRIVILSALVLTTTVYANDRTGTASAILNDTGSGDLIPIVRTVAWPGTTARIFADVPTTTHERVQPDTKAGQPNESNTGMTQKSVYQLGMSVEEPGSDHLAAFDRHLGVVVTHVEPDMAASRAGIHAGDVILDIEGNRISKVADLVNLVDTMGSGHPVPVRVERSGRRFFTVLFIPRE